MNDIREQLRRSLGKHTPTIRPITEGQIETAGRTYTRATVTTAALHAVIAGVQVIGRTLWMLAIAAAGVWTWLHWPQIVHWMK